MAVRVVSYSSSRQERTLVHYRALRQYSASDFCDSENRRETVMALGRQDGARAHRSYEIAVVYRPNRGSDIDYRMGLFQLIGGE